LAGLSLLISVVVLATGMPLSLSMTPLLGASRVLVSM